MTINYGLTYIGMLWKFEESNDELNLNLTKEEMNILVKYFSVFINDISLYKSLDKISKIAEYLGSIGKLFFIKTTNKGIIYKNKKDYDLLLSTGYSKYSDIILDHSVKINKKRKRKRMTVRIFDGNELDLKQHVRALKANLIHHLDCLWLYNYISLIYKRNKAFNIALIHDCSATDLNSINEMNLVLREVLIELFRDEKALWKFLHKLLIDLAADKNYIDELQNDLKQVEKKFIIEDLRESFYLLFP